MRDAIRELMPGLRADLERLVRIPSVSWPAFDPVNVRASATATAELFAAEGLENRLLEIPGAHPAVLAKLPAPPGRPTVLLYAHHDVQPPGDASLWHTPPFEPVERDGRLYGRGTSDDKCGIVSHLAAIRAFEGRPPVGVTVLVEGEEETGSDHLLEFLSAYGEELRADACVLADSGNWRVGRPALTTSLRGIAACTVEVRTLDHAVHSGVFGGPIPDALTTLCRLLASLHDERGNVAVGKRATAPAEPLDLTADELRDQAGVLPGVEMIADGSLTERLWGRPAAGVLAIDAPRVDEASNKLVPVARALVSMRIAPGDDGERALEELEEHLRANVPWGARITIERHGVGEPYAVEPSGAAYDAMKAVLGEAWGTPAVEMGMGGTIPFVSAFARAFPVAALLLTGAGDPGSRAHGENESVDLGDLERSCLAEALLLAKLAQ